MSGQKREIENRGMGYGRVTGWRGRGVRDGVLFLSRSETKLDPNVIDSPSLVPKMSLGCEGGFSLSKSDTV